MIQSIYQKAMKFAGEKHASQKVPGSNANYLLHLSNVAMEIDKMNQKDAVATVTKTLVSMRPSLAGALDFTYYWTWVNNPYAGGAYAYWKPGQITDFANTLADPIGRIHFAGEHTAIMNRGMEGSMESGERAAFELLGLMG